MPYGDENMNTENDEQNENEMKKYTDDMLPELSSEQIEISKSHHCKSWVLSKMGRENIGVFSWFGETGLGLQTVDESTLRCIAVFDHEVALNSLAMMKVSAKSIGVALETEGYTLLQKFPDRSHDAVDDEQNVEVPTGMEVA
jgi:hypothetical protein|tara:strand:+ start:1991 stop:2416 length:426 start_codon:yes stop_codon:yes gene_type:complete